MRYIGPDVHKDNITACVLTSTGKPKFEKDFLKESGNWILDELLDFKDKDGFCVMMESGTYAYAPFRFFSDKGVEVHVVHAKALKVIWSIDPVQVSAGCGHRGRLRKDERPLTKTEYRVNIRLVFDRTKAKRLSQDRNVSVLVTNLPRANKDAENIRFGATADTVLLTYLGQFKVEHAFRLMKSGMGIDRVYIQKPSRENAMMFVISLTTMLSDVMDHILRLKGIGTTFSSMVERMQRLDLRYDRNTDSSHLAGNPEDAREYVEAVKALGIDLDILIPNSARAK